MTLLKDKRWSTDAVTGITPCVFKVPQQWKKYLELDQVNVLKLWINALKLWVNPIEVCFYMLSCM